MNNLTTLERIHDNRYRNCSFFGAQTLEPVAEALGISVGMLHYMARNIPSYYRIYEQQVSPQKRRLIEAPQGQLKVCQTRLKEIFTGEEFPIFYSSRRGRSPISNAAVHRGMQHIATMDIRNFFGSCKSRDVFDHFVEKMQCSPYVAHILTCLTCLNGHLPTGAPTSTLLSFLVYEEMFTGLYLYTGACLCRKSLWVDDLTVSGSREGSLDDMVLHMIEYTLNSYGFSLNHRKTRLYDPRKMAMVTGIGIMPDGELRMPNRLHYKKFQLKEERRAATTDEQRQLLSQRIRSYDAYQAQIKARSRRPVRPFR